jgi:hypothetical protein
MAVAHAITGRTRFPSVPARRFFAGLGRRAGKTVFESRRACFHLAQDYRDRLQKGETAVVACIATDKKQAALLFNYARACVLDSPLLSAQLARETSDTLEFAHGTALEVHTASFRSTRGRTFAAVLMDEAAFLRSEESATPDVEIVRAVVPGLATLGGSLEVFSSLHMRRGVMWDAHRRHFGADGSTAIYVQGDTRTFNPTIDQAVIDESIAEDPELGNSEWGGQFRADLSSAFDPTWIDVAIDSNVFERAFQAVLREGRPPEYKAATDPAGGSGRDSWSTYITHKEGNQVYADACLEIRPPFSTKDAACRVAEFLRSYGLNHVSGDHYAGLWPSDELRANGIGYHTLESPKSDLYREAVGLFSAGRVRLLDHARTTTQLRMLERRVRAGGRDQFDHPANGNDDNANALCAALLIADGRGAQPGDGEVIAGRSDVLDGYTGRNVEPEHVSVFDRARDIAEHPLRDPSVFFN